MTTTYDLQRTEEQKLYDAAVMDNVKRGMALLEEKYGPAWVDKIDLAELQLSSGSACVLGQVYADQAPEGYDGYDVGLVEVGICETIDQDEDYDAEHYGFSLHDFYCDWRPLQQAWEDALTPIVKAKP